MQVLEVAVADIFAPDQGAGPPVDDDFARLKASLAAYGLLQPLVIDYGKAGGFPYRLLLGRRRLAAARALGWSVVSCVLLPVAEPVALFHAAETMTLRAPHFVEQALTMRDLLTSGTASPAQLAERFGLSPGQVMRFLDLAEAPLPVLQELRRIRHLSFAHAYQIAAFAVDHPEEVFEVLRRVARGAPAPYVIRSLLRRERRPARRTLLHEVWSDRDDAPDGARLRLRLLVELPGDVPAPSPDDVRRWMRRQLERRLAALDAEERLASANAGEDGLVAPDPF